MCRAYKVFLATAYPPPDLVKTMKRFLACLALCASLSASAQGDNCTVLGIQDLTQMVFDLQAQLNAQDATIDSLQNAAMTRYSVRAIARGETVVGGSAGFIDLSGANLTGAHLSYANLSFADLSGANLTSAQTYGANFYGADLSNANLFNLILSNANLTGANLSGANLHYANLLDADLDAADLTGAVMTCLGYGCPITLPSGYICEPDPDCPGLDRYRIVPE